ncbi:MAG TPA: large-conductance mechanosensitive channel protein MscL [Candidatus Magasanikbacteria bacterium]|nr:large-conductance mechanosensitive channel protein MscL [Candidatus Magasanikbacteria bacterium]
MPKFFTEFKKFAMRGSVVDMTIGIIVGGAFGKIVTSLVNDIIMPPLGLLIGGVNFKDLKVLLKPGEFGSGGEVITPEVAFNYGAFIQNIFDFLIIALAIFLMVRIINKFAKKEEEKPATAPKQEVLLEEIRDLLKKR